MRLYLYCSDTDGEAGTEAEGVQEQEGAKSGLGYTQRWASGGRLPGRRRRRILCDTLRRRTYTFCLLVIRGAGVASCCGCMRACGCLCWCQLYSMNSG